MRRSPGDIGNAKTLGQGAAFRFIQIEPTGFQNVYASYWLAGNPAADSCDEGEVLMDMALQTAVECVDRSLHSFEHALEPRFLEQFSNRSSINSFEGMDLVARPRPQGFAARIGLTRAASYLRG